MSWPRVTIRPFWTPRFRDFDLTVAITGSLGELDSRCRHVHYIELFSQGFDHDAYVVEVAPEEPFAQRRTRQLQAPCAQVGHGWELADLDLLLGHALNAADMPSAVWAEV